MNWIFWSLTMFFFSVFQYLLLRKIQGEGISNKINNLMMFGSGIPLLAAWVIITHAPIVINFKYIFILIVITFFFSFLGNKFSLSGIKKAPNPGFSLIIQKSYAIYTAFAAIFLFDSELSLQAFLAILMIILFSATIIIDRSKAKETKTIRWIIDSVLAFFLFGNLALVSKWLQNEGLEPTTIVLYIFSIVSVIFGIDLFRSRKNIKFKNINKTIIFLLPLLGISNTMFNLSMQLSYKSALNIGYVNVVNASSITAITIFSTIIFKDKLTIEKLIGVVGVSLGLMLLILP